VYKFVFDEIFKRLEESVDSHATALSYGGPKSFEQYTEVVGRIHGIRLAINDVQDVLDMLDKQEEEEE
jgi:hypothetical protein